MESSGPLKVMPDCWNDEKRINSLFAPFRKKELNPVGWESKMKFWHSVIEKWCLEKNRASFSVQTIKSEFKHNGRTPVCIATVIEELLRTGEVKSKSEFLSLDPSKSWTAWALDSFVKQPVSWSLGKFKNYWTAEPESIQLEEEFVHMNYLKESANKVYNEADTQEDDLISCKEIIDILSNGESRVSMDTVECVIQYLRLEGLAVVQLVENTKLIKLLKKHDGKTESKEITQADVAVFKLQQNKAVLQKNLEHLESEKDRCVLEAKAYLDKGLRQSAKNSLRKKKQLEKCIEKRSITLDNLDSLLDSLRNTVSDSEVIDAYKLGLAALKGTFKSSGLSEDGVFETMAQLQDMNEMQEEIQQAMSQSVNNVGDDDLELELSSILNKSQANIELPDVPTYSLDSLLPESESDTKKKKLPTEPNALHSF